MSTIVKPLVIAPTGNVMPDGKPEAIIRQIADDEIINENIAQGQPGDKGDQGDAGSQGDQGPQGLQGPSGDIALKDIVLRSLWPDTLFKLSGGDVDYTFGGLNLYDSGMNNFVWDSGFYHCYGKGAWYHDGSNAALTGFPVPITYGQQSVEFGLGAGDKISVGAIVRSKTGSGSISLYVRFKDINGSYVTGQLASTVTATGEDQLIAINDVEITADAASAIVYFADSGAETDFYILSLWVVPCIASGLVAPINNMELWDQLQFNNRTTESVLHEKITSNYNQLLTSVADNSLVTNAPVYKSADFDSHGTIYSTFSGWAAPFDWDGTKFDMIKINFNSEFSGLPIRVAIWSGDQLTRLAYAEITPFGEKGVIWAKLSSVVSTELVASGVLYVAIDSPGGKAVLARVTCSNAVTVSDPVTYPQKYTVTTNPSDLLSLWIPVSTPNSSPLYFEVFDSELMQSAPLSVASDLLASPDAHQPILPPRIFALEGIETNIYINDLSSSSSGVSHDVVSSNGSQFSNRWTFTPTSSAVSGDTMTFSVLDRKDLYAKGSASTALWSVAHGACNTLNRRVCCIGDSTTAAGVWTQQMITRASEDSTDLQLTMVGTAGSGANLHEGRSGWTAERYYQPDPIDMAENPFVDVDGDKFNASDYLTNTSQPAPDVVIWHLGINDVFGYTSDHAVNLRMDAVISQLDEMIGIVDAGDVGSWKEVNTSIATIIALPISPTASQDSFGADYASNQTRARYKRNITVAAHRLNEHYKTKEADKIFLLPWNVTVDTEYGFPTITENANQHNSTQVTRQSNSVHPETSGYKQMGDQAYAALNVLAANGDI